jgi:hypothetical protein
LVAWLACTSIAKDSEWHVSNIKFHNLGASR